MIATITAITEQQLIFVVSTVTKLAISLHDALVPSDAGLEHVERHSELRRCVRSRSRLPPGVQTPWCRFLRWCGRLVILLGVIRIVCVGGRRLFRLESRQVGISGTYA